MKNLLIALTFVLTSTTAFASTSNVKFVTTDNSKASNLCVAAAEKGLTSAIKRSGDEFALATKCNGQSIRAFSRAYHVENKEVENVTSKKVLVVPANASTESKVCVQAVKYGIKSVVGTVDFNVETMQCNGQKIDRFVKRYSKSELIKI